MPEKYSSSIIASKFSLLKFKFFKIFFITSSFNYDFDISFIIKSDQSQNLKNFKAEFSNKITLERSLWISIKKFSKFDHY